MLKKNTGYLFFRNPPLLQISTFSLGQKGCAYYEKSAYYECAYYERAQYANLSTVIFRFSTVGQGYSLDRGPDLDKNFRVCVTCDVGSEFEVGFSGIFVKNR